MSARQTGDSQPAEVPVARTLVLESGLGAAERTRLAVSDLADAGRLWRLALTLGWFDIRLRYRGSMLGPFWLTLSTAIMVASLGVLYARLFNMELRDYLPYLALSLVLWNVLSAIISEACTCFTAAEGMIRSIRMPYTIQPVRIVVRNMVVLAHNIPVILVVYLWFDIWPGWPSLAAIPGLALWVIDGLAVCLIFGPIGARFRDIPPIIGSIIQIAFFVSPVLWKPELLQGAALDYLPLNPFYTVLEVVRGPLLGETLRIRIWASAIGYSALLALASWLLFTRTRSRLAFWV